MINIDFNDRRIKIDLADLLLNIKSKYRIQQVIGGTLRDWVKNTISRQGSIAGSTPWAPLAASTRQRTGRKKALASWEKDIKYVATEQGVTVYLDRYTKGYTTQMHGRGYSIPFRRIVPGDGKSVMYITRGLSRSRIKFFRAAYGAKIPPRNIWPSLPMVVRIIRKVAEKWIENGVPPSLRRK